MSLKQLLGGSCIRTVLCGLAPLRENHLEMPARRALMAESHGHMVPTISDTPYAYARP
jgi:hypothetical protein